MRCISVPFPCLSSDWLRHIEPHRWLSTKFLQEGRYLLLLIFKDICNMYQQNFDEIPENPACVLPQSDSVHGTADMHCLLIDPSKTRKLATTISCYDYLSCKSSSVDQGNQLLPYLYYIGKYFEDSQSDSCHFELWHKDGPLWGTFFEQMQTLMLPLCCPFIEQALDYYSC